MSDAAHPSLHENATVFSKYEYTFNREIYQTLPELAPVNSTISVLLVDDEPAFIEAERIFFDRTGNFTCDIAYTAIEALAKLERQTYDVIISDYDMPEMDGIVFLKAVKKRFPDIPFIIFTGRGREEVVIEALNNGAEYYLQKGGDAKSQFTELISKVQHIVERRMTEHALEQSEERYALLVDMSPDMIAIYKEDTVLYINPVGLTMLGCSNAEEFYSRPFSAYFHKKDRDFLKTALHHVEELSEKTGNIECTFTRLDSTAFDAEFGPVQIYYRGERAVLLMVRDITERRKAERELRIRDTAIEHAINPIILTDTSGILTYANRAFPQVWGITSPNNVLGRHIGEFCDLGLTAGNPLEGLADRQGEVVTARQADGTRFYVRIVTTPVYGKDAKPFCFMASFEDVTEERHLRERENEALSLIEENITGIAVINDEIRNPLTVIMAYAGMIETPEGEIIEQQVEEIETLIHRIDRGWILSDTMKEFLKERTEKE